MVEWIKQNKIAAASIVAIVVVAVAFLFLPGRARADGPTNRGKIAATGGEVTKLWTGIYLGGFGTYGTGSLGDSGPIDISATGPSAGVAVGINVQTGQIVWGAELNHAWFFGDLKDVGLNTEIEYLGRVGYLWNPRSLVYVHGSFVQIDTSWGNFEGWGYGVGIETKTPLEGWSLDLRAGVKDYDVESIHSDAEAHVLYARLGLNKRFDLPVGWLGQ